MTSILIVGSPHYSSIQNRETKHFRSDAGGSA